MVSYDIDMLFSPRCRKEKITLYTGNASTAATTITAEVAEEELHRLFGLCSSDNCPTLIHTEVLHVHFVSGERDSGTPKTGFRVFFSFHNQSALLQGELRLLPRILCPAPPVLVAAPRVRAYLIRCS